jgi:hypothetical protein
MCYFVFPNGTQPTSGGELMSAETLALISGTLLSLFFSYIPGARSWFEPFPAQVKRLIMLVLLLGAAGIVYGLSCLGWGAEWHITLTCDQQGLMGLIEQTVIAIIANQSIYAISPHRDGSTKPQDQSPSDPKFV